MPETMPKTPARDPDRALVIFDGHCGLCNGFVDSLLRHPRRDRFRFTPRQGETGARMTRTFPQLEQADSIIVLPAATDQDPSPAPRVRSNAVITIARELGGWRAAAANLLAVIPTPLRDLGYRLIARLRHTISRRRESCRLPTPDEQPFFLP